jgi:4-diphosphocytidyl-2-C-methyl-D-erythritol kinase
MRDDGYHDIESLMQVIDFYDQLTLEKSDVIELHCSDSSLPSDERNLASRAAAILQSEFYFPGVKIHLTKKIPIGAGLGGGSSDAAFVLRGLCQLYGLRPSIEEITDLAASVGSDVPFFLTTGQALVTGRGEKLEPLQLPLDYHVVLAIPEVSIATADVYRAAKINLTKKNHPILLGKRIRHSRFLHLAEAFGNDLEDVVLNRFPELGELKRSMLGAGAFYSGMSGSGSSFFGLFVDGGIIRKGMFEKAGGVQARVHHCRPILLPPFGS